MVEFLVGAVVGAVAWMVLGNKFLALAPVKAVVDFVKGLFGL